MSQHSALHPCPKGISCNSVLYSCSSAIFGVSAGGLPHVDGCTSVQSHDKRLLVVDGCERRPAAICSRTNCDTTTKFQLPQAAPTTVKWQAALSPELARWARETCEASEFAFANSLPHSSHQASLPAPTFKASLPAPTSKSSEQRWEVDICNPRSQSHSCSNTMHAIRPAHYMHMYQSHHISPSHQAISPSHQAISRIDHV